MRHTALRGSLAVAFMVGVFVLAFHRIALPHDAPRGWSYGVECCSDRDCAPIPSRGIKPMPDGSYLLPTGELVEKSKIKRSGDEEYHLCRSEVNQHIFCLYAPPFGS